MAGKLGVDPQPESAALERELRCLHATRAETFVRVAAGAGESHQAHAPAGAAGRQPLPRSDPDRQPASPQGLPGPGRANRSGGNPRPGSSRWWQCRQNPVSQTTPRASRRDPLGQQVGRGERGVRLQRQLVGIGAGGAHPGPTNPRPPPAQGDRALLAAVPHRHPSRVVLALGTGQLDHLDVHQLTHDLPADRGRGGQQPLGSCARRTRPGARPPGQPATWAAQPCWPTPAEADSGRRPSRRSRRQCGSLACGVLLLRTWSSQERLMSGAPGRTPPQIPRTSGQPRRRAGRRHRRFGRHGARGLDGCHPASKGPGQ
jgi:hypothetical protein